VEEDRVNWLQRLDDEDGLFGPLTEEEQEELAAERLAEVERELELMGYQPEERDLCEEDEVWRMRKQLGLLGHGVGVRKTTTPGEAARGQIRVAHENAPERPCGCGFGYTCLEHRAVQMCGSSLEERRLHATRKHGGQRWRRWWEAEVGGGGRGSGRGDDIGGG